MMLSSDKNVETIAQLAQVLKHYVGLQTEFLKLNVIEKLVRLLTAMALAVVFFLILLAVMLFLSIAFAFWLSQYTGNTLAFCIVGGIYIVLFILFFTFRKPWIEKPLVSFLASLLMSK